MQFFDGNGDPLAGGKVYTYEANTDDPKATYTNAAGDTPLTNPIILDASGRAEIWLDGSYKIEVYDALDNLIKSVDNINSFNDADITNRAQVTDNDALPGFLSDKITAGDKISISVENPGADEKLVIATTGLGSASTKDAGTETGNVPALEFIDKVEAPKDFSDDLWVKNNCTVTANVTTDPDGGATADLIVEDSATDMHFISQKIDGFDSDNEITYTIYAKTENRSFAYLAISDAADAQTNSVSVIVNLANGNTGTLANNGTATDGAVTVEDEGSGWWKITLSGIINPNSPSSGVYVQIGPAQDLTTPSYEGDGASGIYVWDASAGMAGFPQVDGSQLVNIPAGYEHIATYVASASASVDIVLPEGYIDFEIIGENIVPSANAASLYLRTSTDGGSTFTATASSYAYRYIGATAATEVTSTAQNTFIDLQHVGTSNNAAHGGMGINLRTVNARKNQKFGISWNYSVSGASNTNVHGNGTAMRNAVGIINALRFLMSSGNIASGTFYLIGKKA
jgi:hypothetical protein